MALLVRNAQNVLCIFRPIRIKPLTIQELQCVEYRRSLLRAALSPYRSQSVLRGLWPVLSRYEHGKEGVLRSLVLEMRFQANARNNVHQVAKVDPLMGPDTRNVADGLALS